MSYQILDLQRLKERHLLLEILQNQSYNLNEIQVFLGQDSYDFHYPLEFKKSEDKNAPWAETTKIGWALSGPLPAKQAATTATSIIEDKLASQLSKWWDIEPYAAHRFITGHSKGEQREIKKLEQTTRFTGERYEFGLLCLEEVVKLPNTALL